LDTISDEHKSYAVRILQFLTFSERPLSVTEIIDAIAVNTDEGPYFDPSDRMPDHQEISRYCSSLVVVVSTESNNVLQLAHFSVKEYLVSNRVEGDVAPQFQKFTASASIARVCLAYLLQFDQELQPNEVLNEFPLAKYSATFWMSFAAVDNGEEDSLMGLIERFFCFLGAPYKICYGIHRPDEPWKDLRWLHDNMSTPASPLYYAALGALPKTVRLLLEKNADVNAQGGEFGNALQAASARGHEQMVELLLKNNADVNAQGGNYGNALQAASHKGHERVVKLLLEKNASINVQGRHYGNALQAASFQGHEQVVKLLLDKGIDPYLADTHGRTALHFAAKGGHFNTVQFLIDLGLDPMTTDAKGDDILCYASLGGSVEIISAVLDKVPKSLRESMHWGPLHWACRAGKPNVVDLLIREGYFSTSVVIS
jgi:ankyrin repeat protein